MKTKGILLMLVVVAAAFIMAKPVGKPSPASTYFVLSPHTSEQCMNMLTEMKDKGDAYLTKFYFGCKSGDHTAYAFLQGNSESDVKMMLPKDMQAGSKIIKVDKFTAAQIDKMHHEMSTK